jgi:hypothetical protein
VRVDDEDIGVTSNVADIRACLVGIDHRWTVRGAVGDRLEQGVDIALTPLSKAGVDIVEVVLRIRGCP